MARSLESFGLLPQSVLSLRDYSWSKFWSDLVAGLTVGLVALPLAMAFAISSGVKPESGIFTAIIAGFLISALGGSTTQIGGPTGAFVVVVSGIVEKYHIEGLYMCTLLAGIMLVLLGVTGLGTTVKFIPRPVVFGFTNGIAILIASTQIKDFLGLSIEKVPGEFPARMQAIAQNLSTVNWTSAALGTATIAIIIFFRKYVIKVPGSIVALVALTAVAVIFKLPVETIQSRFGEIKATFPTPRVPEFRVDLILPLLSPALTICMLGAIESLLSAVVADRMTGDKHNPNTELVAQGIANIFSPLFKGLPATGAIARTVTNIRSGGKTPVAGMVHALTLLLIIVIAAPIAKLIPLCVLAGILFMVAYNMGEWKEIPEIVSLGKAPATVWAITFFLTVFADLTVAVEAGMMMAMLLYIRRVTSTTTVSRVTNDYIEEGRHHSLQVHPIPAEAAVYRIHGPFLFGATDKLRVVRDEINDLPKVVVLRLRNMTAMDTSALRELEDIAAALHKTDRTLLICGARGQPAELIERSKFAEHIGAENILPNLQAAIDRANHIIAGI